MMSMDGTGLSLEIGGLENDLSKQIPQPGIDGPMLASSLLCGIGGVHAVSSSERLSFFRARKVLEIARLADAIGPVGDGQHQSRASIP
jgi:hypothetical protein